MKPAADMYRSSHKIARLACVNIAKFIRTPILKNISEPLLPHVAQILKPIREKRQEKQNEVKLW